MMGLMIQSANAEALAIHGRGYRTWRYDADQHGYPKVTTFRLDKKKSELAKMAPDKLWYYTYEQLAKLPDRTTTRDLAITAFTGYDVKTKKLSGHAALGGGSLALFSSINLHAWPEKVSQIEARFLNSSKVDTSKLPDDSAYRKTYGGNAATGIGACWHEFGHTFNLPNKESGVMGRGFDYINRYFVIRENFWSHNKHISKKDLVGWRKDSVEVVINDPFVYLNNDSSTLRVPGNYSSIENALKRAKPGDTVKVAKGVYKGNFQIPAGVKLIGAGDGKSVLKGTGKGSSYSMGNGSMIKGFTITGSGKEYWDAGVFIANHVSNVTIESNIFTNNSMGVVQYCFEKNNACRVKNFFIKNNQFKNNRNGAVIVHGQVTVTGNTILSGRPLIDLKHEGSIKKDNEIRNKVAVRQRKSKGATRCFHLSLSVKKSEVIHRQSAFLFG